jgi:cell division protease FtsH
MKMMSQMYINSIKSVKLPQITQSARVVFYSRPKSRGSSIVHVLNPYYLPPTTSNKTEVVVTEDKRGTSSLNKYETKSLPEEVFGDEVSMKEEDDIPKFKNVNNEILTFQIISFILQNGFSIFFAIMILVSFFAQRNAIAKQSQFFTQSKKAISAEEVDTTFADVAGCDNAKLELAEVVDFLKNPDKYTKVGAKIPKGCLLTGGPGLGKTLLARAVAGEAGVPFFACSASEFIELFVGVGSSRVRDLFKQAKEAAPCIIFIDEIDAIGKSRSGNSSFGSNDEREQTINQLLTEMDGFAVNKAIVVMAATNRADILDKALVRPGRFDRQIMLDPPTVKDREAILKIHCEKKPISEDVSFSDLAANTVGLSGAELANIANEAAILAARRGGETIEMNDFYGAIDRVLLGPEKKNDLVKKKNLVACHEAGHALVALKVGDFDKLSKISIVPRGKTGGVTMFEPLEENVDSGLYTKQYMENRLAVALGGRAAEEIVYGSLNITTGAYSDMEVVQQIAKAMVCNYGFSDELGHVSWSSDKSPLGQSTHSMYVQTKIDKEIMKITQQAYTRAKNIINNNYDLFLKIAEGLIQKEVLTKKDIEELLNQPRFKNKS